MVTTQAEPPGERASRLRQRQRLIDASISALHSFGPSRTTVEKVVAIAGLSPGTVSFYFDSKAAMLLAALEYLAGEFDTQVLAPVAALADQPVRALNRLVELMVDPEIASPRKVSVWYAFWGEATSREEYSEICGKRDAEFGVMVETLIERLIAETGQHHLDADGIALGLVGALEILWQSFAFEDEARIDRTAAKKRCMAYLKSVFPGVFVPGAPAPAAATPVLPQASPYADPALFAREWAAIFRPAWSVVAHEADLPLPGDFVTATRAGERVLILRDKNGAIRAFRNACRRRPHALVEDAAGRFEGVIRCAADGLEYGLDGERGDGGPGLEGLPIARSNSPPPLAGGGREEGWTAVAEASRADALGTAPSSNLLPRGEEASNTAMHPGRLILVSLAPPGNPRVPAFPPMRSVGAWESVDVSADWKTLVEQWLDRAEAAVPDDSELTIDWTDGETERSFLFPNLLIETRGSARRLLQADPIAAGKCRLMARVFGAQDHAWPTLDATARLAQSTQAGLVAPGAGPGETETSPALDRFRAWCRAGLAGG